MDDTRPTHAPTGKFAPGNALASLGGKRKGQVSRLARKLGLIQLPPEHAFRPYKREAGNYRRAVCAGLARDHGGYCGPGPSSLVASAALQLAWSRYLSDTAAQANDPDLAMLSSRMSDASARNLIAARDLCEREAQARREQRPAGGGAEEFMRPKDKA